MNTILYATDFSVNAQTALKYAYELSRKSGAALIMLHVFDIPALMNSPESQTYQEMQRDVSRLSKNRLQSLCETHLGKEAMKSNIRFEARGNKSPVQGILEMIGTCHADLVVVGTKGESKLREWFMGSTSKGLIEKAGCPVLAVPKEAVYKAADHIVYATDLEEKDVAAILALTEIAGLYDAPIRVIHISEKDKYAGKEKKKWFRELLAERVSYPALNFEWLNADDVYKELDDYLVASDADMIVMLEREKESLFERWFHRDMVKRMDFHTTIPLLSFHEKYLASPFVMGKEKTEQIRS